MKKDIILMKNNIRKNLGQYISFAIMILIAAIMLNLGIITKLNFKEAFDEKWAKQNSADVFLTISEGSYSEELINEIEEIKNVKALEERAGILLKGAVSYGGNDLDITQNFYSLDDVLNKNNKMNKIEILEEGKETYDNPIYLSNWMKLSGGYKIGDEYNFEIDNERYEFTVAGFVEDMQYGTNALGLVAAYLPEKGFEDLKRISEDKDKTITILVEANDITNSKAIYNEVSKKTSGKLNGFSVMSYYDACRNVRTMTTDIFVAIFVVFAALVAIISILVVNFKISNRIEEEMTNMGALKAIGYTGRQIMIIMITPYLFIALVTVSLGIVASYGILPIIEGAFAAQTGIVWQQGFSVSTFIITMLIIITLILLSCYLSARKIKKLRVVEALRGGIKSHSFRKNYFSIHRTKGNINIILSLKSFINNLRQNILLLVVIIAVSIATLFAGTMFYNSVIKTENLINILAEETPSLSITFNDEKQAEEKKAIEHIKGIKKSLYYDIDTVKFNDENNAVFISEDFSQLKNNICYEGRSPIHSNEIALGSESAKEANVNIGDIIEISYGDIAEDYLITGFIQSVNYSGKAMQMTSDGFEKINKDFTAKTLFIYLNDDVNRGKFIEEVKENFNNKVSIIDYEKSTASAVEVFVKIIGILCVGIFIFTAVLITLILYLLIKTIIVHKKQEMGILKSMGYTSLNLIIQTSLSFIPTSIIGSIIGTVIGYKYMNGILAAMLSAVGVMKVEFQMPVVMVIICALVINIFTFIISIFLCRNIKRISAYSLISE